MGHTVYTHFGFVRYTNMKHYKKETRKFLKCFNIKTKLYFTTSQNNCKVEPTGLKCKYTNQFSLMTKIICFSIEKHFNVHAKLN